MFRCFKKKKCNPTNDNTSTWLVTLWCYCRNPTLREVWGRHSHSRKMGLESPLGFPKTQSSIAGVKTPRLEVFFILLERSWSVDVQNDSCEAILDICNTSLWLKERLGVKLTVWLPTTKNQESTQPRCVQVECNTLLEISQGELQVCFTPHPDRRFEQEVTSCQSP